MSTALAHHYFGSKERIFLAAMRHILTQYRQATTAALKTAGTPRERLTAIIHSSFGGPNLERETIAAWLNFYALAFVEPDAARLLRVYHRRLRSNLMVVLRPQVGAAAADVALTLGALIDGVYLRVALSDDLDGGAAERLTFDYLEKVLP